MVNYHHTAAIESADLPYSDSYFSSPLLKQQKSWGETALPLLE